MKQEEVLAYEVGYGLHVCLRKALDGNASSILWNVIYLMDEEWESFLYNICKDGVQPGFFTKEKCLAASRELMGKHVGNIFRVGLDLLSDEEYKILEGLLIERRKPTEKPRPGEI